MEVLIEILLQVIGEFLLQILLEVLAEVGMRSLTEPLQAKPHPGYAALGYVLLGGAAGALSLWPFPTLFVRSHYGRVASLLLVPLLAGGTMVLLGAWRRRRDQELVRLDRFAYSFLFALVMGLVRYRFGR